MYLRACVGVWVGGDVYVHVHVCVCVWVGGDVYVHVHVCVCVGGCVSGWGCIRACTRVCVCVCACICMRSLVLCVLVAWQKGLLYNNDAFAAVRQTLLENWIIFASELMRMDGSWVGLAQTVHGISIYCIYAVYDRIYAVYDRIYAVYDRIYAVFPYIPYMRKNEFTQNNS